MNLPISIKAEKAIALDYLPDALGIVGLNIYEGHEAVESIELPCLTVYSEGSSQTDGMPMETCTRTVRMRFKFTANSDNHSRSDVNLWADNLEVVMLECFSDLQDVLNMPVGTDNRTVKGIHFHHIEMTDDPSDREERNWIEDLVFDITCEKLSE